MRVAVVGSRSLTAVDLAKWLLPETTEIISGGAGGIDQLARDFAMQHQLKYTEFPPDYTRYGRSAPLKRSDTIIQSAELVLIFWDGVSRGSAYVIRRCQELAIPHRVIHP